MTWEQKFHACSFIGEYLGLSLRMRTPGDWYVSHRAVDMVDRNSSTHSYGNGKTPEEAVNAHWDKLTSLAPGKFLRSQRCGTESFVKWNGFMWEPTEGPK